MYWIESKKHPSFNEQSVEIITPTLNEETTIEKILQKELLHEYMVTVIGN